MPLDDCEPVATLVWIVFGKMSGSPTTTGLCLMPLQKENCLYDLVVNYFKNENFGVQILSVIESKEDIEQNKL